MVKQWSQLHRAFNAFDQDDSGFVTAKEFKLCIGLCSPAAPLSLTAVPRELLCVSLGTSHCLPRSLHVTLTAGLTLTVTRGVSPTGLLTGCLTHWLSYSPTGRLTH